MPMAPRSIAPLGLLLAVLVAFAALVRASADKDNPPSAAAADMFLRECCADTTNATVCYDSLLPRACSFQGNLVKVAGAAGSVAFAQLRSFHAALLRLQPADMVLKSCVSSAKAALDGEVTSLGKLRRLETAAGRSGEQGKLDLLDANLGIEKVRVCISLCTLDLEATGDAALASPVGKNMVAWSAKVSIYADIALDLVNSIKL